jgi:hypothetical protein
MFTSNGSSVLKAFVYGVVAVLAACSILAIVGFIFAGHLPGLAIVELSHNLCYIAAILLFVHAICFCFVMIFQFTKLYEYVGYIILSFVATLSYVIAWLASPSFVHHFEIYFK